MPTAKQRYRTSPKGKATEAKYRLNYKPRERALAKARYYNGVNVKQKDRYLRICYGLTIDGWQALFEAQNCSCAVCKSTDPNDKWGRWHTDHNHTTGAVRGILCAKCNKALGMANDDPDRLRGLAEYLDERNYCPMPAEKLEQTPPRVV